MDMTTLVHPILDQKGPNLCWTVHLKLIRTCHPHLTFIGACRVLQQLQLQPQPAFSHLALRPCIDRQGSLPHSWAWAMRRVQPLQLGEEAVLLVPGVSSIPAEVVMSLLFPYQTAVVR